MHKKDGDPEIQGFVSYLSKRKKPWSVAVFDKKSKKRAVGKNLGDIIIHFKKVKNPELVVIDFREWEHREDD